MTVHALLERLTSDRPALIRRQAQADRVLAASSAGHLVHEMSVHRRPWRVDPLPLVLDGATFGRLAAGIVERVEALDASSPTSTVPATSSPMESSPARHSARRPAIASAR